MGASVVLAASAAAAVVGASTVVAAESYLEGTVVAGLRRSDCL